MLYLIYWLLGILLGFAFANFYFYHKNQDSKTSGFIEIDPKTNLCKFIVIDPEKIQNHKTKQVFFIIKHDVDLSREEQVL